MKINYHHPFIDFLFDIGSFVYVVSLVTYEIVSIPFKWAHGKVSPYLEEWLLNQRK